MAPSGPHDEEDETAPDLADDRSDEDDFDGFTVDEENDLPFEGESSYDDDPVTEADPLPGPTEEGDDEDDREDDVAPLLAADDDLAEVVAAVDEDVDADEDDAVREGEFICRSCFMAKRDSALADEDAMLCRDCV